MSLSVGVCVLVGWLVCMWGQGCMYEHLFIGIYMYEFMYAWAYVCMDMHKNVTATTVPPNSNGHLKAAYLPRDSDNDDDNDNDNDNDNDDDNDSNNDNNDSNNDNNNDNNNNNDHDNPPTHRWSSVL